MGNRSFRWRNWWWVAIFICLIPFAYCQAIQGKKRVLNNLTQRMQELESERNLALELKSDLALRIQSQSDPAWVELVLMRDLGVVPEGWLKVHFEK